MLGLLALEKLDDHDHTCYQDHDVTSTRWGFDGLKFVGKYGWNALHDRILSDGRAYHTTHEGWMARTLP